MPPTSLTAGRASLALTLLLFASALTGCLSEVEPEPEPEPEPTTPTPSPPPGGGGANGSAPAIEWKAAYGTDHEEHVHEGYQTADGGYVAIGHLVEAEDGPHGPTDVLVMKVDSTGAEEWQRRIGTADAYDVGIAIAEIEDGYILGVGLAADGRQQRGLVKLALDGTVVWQRTYGGGGQGAVRGVDVLADGSILATGYVNESEGGFVFIADEANGFLIKVDESGELLWDLSLTGFPQGTKVREEANGTIAVLSTVWVEVDGNEVQNMMVMRTDANGNAIDTFSAGGAHRVQAHHFDLMPDGGFVIAGNTDMLGSVNWNCVVARLDSAGSVLWIEVFGNPRGYDPKWVHDECYGVRVLPDGGVVVVGGTGDEYEEYSASGHSSGTSDEWKAYVLWIDDDGKLLAEGVYGDPGRGSNAAEFVAVTSDGGFMLFNDTDSDGAPAPNNFGFMKLEPLDRAAV